MQIRLCDDFDINKIANCGQAFRWKRLSENTYQVIAFGKKRVFSQEGEILTIDCESDEYDSIWKRYLDMEECYSEIREMVDTEDAYLQHCVEVGKGIRILRQDPFEMLISFIISQRKSIPAIKTSIERLCAMCGAETFPEASQIAKLSTEQLESCGLGYRTEYIREASLKVASGIIDLVALDKLSDAELKNELLKIKGVGEKVASCIMLFGYHRLNSFPKDVWINRALEEHYKEGFSFESYEPFCGVMQQYMFYGSVFSK